MTKKPYNSKTNFEKFLYLSVHPNCWYKLLVVIIIKFNQKIKKPLINFYYSIKAINNQGAIYQICGERKSFFQKFEKEIKEAQEREKTCPVKMGAAGDLELIYQLTEHIGATRAIETGVAYGWSSLTFLLSLKNRQNSLLISTDLSYSEKTTPYVGYVIPEALKKKWRLIKEADKTALPQALKILPEIDICHYDSDKTYKGRMFAYPLLWDALRSGGILISDDIGDNLAFNHFAKYVDVKPIIVKKNKGHVGLLLKKL